MPSIFVSYRRTDAPGHAGRLYDRLVGRFGQANVYKDLDSMEPGVDFVEAIEGTIARCDAMVAVIGRDWLESQSASGQRRIDDPQDWVRVELARALTRNIRVVPVLVDSAVMPAAESLPEDIRTLTRRHAVVLSETAWAAQVDQLLDALWQSPASQGKRRRRSPPGRAKPSPARTASSSRRRWTIALTATFWLPLVSLGYDRANQIATLVGAAVGLLLAALLFVGSTRADARRTGIRRLLLFSRTSPHIATAVFCWLLIAVVAFVTAAVVYNFID